MISLSFRSLLTVGATALLFACSSTTGGAGNPNGTGTGNGNGTGTGTGTGDAIDGTWDITAAGGDEVGPSEITIKNGTVTGALVSADEGTKDGSGCTRVKDRVEVAINIQGNALSGTFTEVRERSGTDCPAKKSEITTVSGTRSGEAKTGETRLEGSWEVRVGDEKPFLLQVTGLTGKVFSNPKDTSVAPSVTIAIAGDSATASAKRDRHSFAAKKR